MKQPIDYARDDLGTWEWKDGHNPKVVQYFADVGHAWVKDDETAWCAAFVGAMLKRAGLQHTGKLTARSYLEWGDPVALDEAREGDVVVFPRGNSAWQGHVGFVVGLDGEWVDVLGGNQSNQVNIKRYPTGKILGIRRWPDQIVHPDPAEQPPGNPLTVFINAIAAILRSLFGGKS